MPSYLLLSTRSLKKDDYLVNQNSLGQRFRKARMNAGLQIEDFAVIIGLIY
jgi:hypothetical protein